jgi:hypothetical protein
MRVTHSGGSVGLELPVLITRFQKRFPNRARAGHFMWHRGDKAQDIALRQRIPVVADARPTGMRVPPPP